VVPARAPRPDYPRVRRPPSASSGDLARLAGRYRLGGYFELELAGATVASVAARLLTAVRRVLRGDPFALIGARTWADRALAFSGMLELIREGQLTATQERPFAPITVALAEAPTAEPQTSPTQSATAPAAEPSSGPA